jgi:EPS-associated MarR family transcriptional regulator
LQLLESHPDLSQRGISQELGISLGAVNYCLKGLIEKGLVKIQNVRAAKNKLHYSYILTPRGISKKATLTARFLQRRLKEYDALKKEIKALEKTLENSLPVAEGDT